ncbi:sigma-70 family RNA polymerase sigma factor [Temperatibacter marinus]|uniref:RNA polymerase sigma factor n=1 Tax=Temperatibacter marinus TaxID=1456591 RepID=A0AA52EHD4_9PROT|nr:sigma-70 family RNA polymerase sigma factor [Temperatibacter marinus]WND03688.1 sigma-70 family RNA polymerase sigma factor [Temperatibacter marinus]
MFSGVTLAEKNGTLEREDLTELHFNSSKEDHKTRKMHLIASHKKPKGTPAVDEARRRKSSNRFNLLIENVARKHCKVAFAELYEHFAPRVKSFAIKGGVGEDVAEEVAQETMVMVWRKAALFDGSKAAASTWIFTIARNKRIDHQRRTNKPSLSEFDFIHLENEMKDQGDEYEIGQDTKSVRSQMEKLPDDQKAVIIKAFMEEKSHSVVAEEMGLPLGTVKSRIRIALKKLRGQLDE